LNLFEGEKECETNPKSDPASLILLQRVEGCEGEGLKRREGGS
jgi:hypothetical protein